MFRVFPGGSTGVVPPGRARKWSLSSGLLLSLESIRATHVSYAAVYKHNVSPMGGYMPFIDTSPVREGEGRLSGLPTPP